jgi:hypothetical protein
VVIGEQQRHFSNTALVAEATYKSLAATANRLGMENEEANWNRPKTPGNYGSSLETYL